MINCYDIYGGVRNETRKIQFPSGIHPGISRMCDWNRERMEIPIYVRSLRWSSIYSDLHDFPAYYEVGVAKQLIMADDIELSDGAADFEADPVIAKGDRAVCDAMSNEEDIYGWNAGNTTVTIQNGEITHVNRIWVP